MNAFLVSLVPLLIALLGVAFFAWWSGWSAGRREERAKWQEFLRSGR